MRKPVLILLGLILIGAISAGIMFWFSEDDATTIDESDHTDSPIETISGGIRDTLSGALRSGSGAGRDDEPKVRPIRLSPATRTEVEGVGRLKGQVVSLGTGKGVSGAELTFQHGQSTASTVTSGEGFFDFRPREAGRYELLSVIAPGFDPFAPAWGQSPLSFEARDGVQVEKVVLHLTPRTRIRIRVENKEGEPVPEAKVRVWGAPRASDMMAPSDLSLTTDGEGQCEAEISAGALVEAQHETYGGGRRYVGRSARLMNELVIKLDPRRKNTWAATLEGVVIAGGNPIEGAVVRSMSGRASTTTDPEGRFTLDGLEEGRTWVEASHPKFESKRSVAFPGKEARIELNASTELTGQVIDDETGEPVPSFTVVVAVKQGVRRRRLSDRTVFDADGYFSVPIGKGPPRIISAAASGYAPSEWVAATGTPIIRLSKGSVFRGKVVEREAKTPIASATVSLEGEWSSVGSFPVSSQAITGADGSFELTGLAEGMRLLSVEAPGHHMRSIAGINVRAGSDPAPMTIELSVVEEGDHPRVELFGIGASLRQTHRGLVVMRVYDESGAAQAGLKRGDTIVAVDGVRVKELGFEGSIGRIRGPENSMVALLLTELSPPAKGQKREMVERQLVVRRARVRSD